MSSRHAISLIIVSTLTMLGGAVPAWATMDNLKSYKTAYPGKEAKAYSCKACHQGAVGKKGDLNAYGAALQAFKAATPADAKKLTEDDYRAFEAADSDGDGATNLQELEAGTDLADPAAVPGQPPAEPQASGEEPVEEGVDAGHEDHEHVHPAGEPSSRAPGLPEQLQAYLDRVAMPEAWADEASTTEPAASAPAAAEYVGTETCAACHVKEYKEFQQSTHARIAIPGGAMAQGCETCHGPGSLHAEAGGGKGVGGLINPRKDPSTCFECHTDKRAQFHLPYHHPVLEGKMSCADCHNAHGEDVRPWSATTLADVNDACFKCHKDQRGPFVWEHEALREGCASCHQVHGSINQKMLLARDNNLCLRCHTQVNFPTIGNSSHSTRFLEGSCFSASCHTAPHGSNFDDHLRY